MFWWKNRPMELKESPKMCSPIHTLSKLRHSLLFSKGYHHKNVYHQDNFKKNAESKNIPNGEVCPIWSLWRSTQNVNLKTATRPKNKKWDHELYPHEELILFARNGSRIILTGFKVKKENKNIVSWTQEAKSNRRAILFDPQGYQIFHVITYQNWKIYKSDHKIYKMSLK
jgi:hypothetical protein